jgi:predicted AAA+ superfamily ATPase
MRRHLEESIIEDLKQKVVILSGPRQVGKTTLSKQLIPSLCYLNFDSSSDRDLIRKQEWDRDVELVVFDELHKMKKWKSWIKGIYDTEGIPPSLLVTGSARIETAKKGGDSLAGRFFSYRLHPLSVKEILHCLEEDPKQALNKLIDIGGFPEPYLKGKESYAKRWRRTHIDTIIRQDLIDFSLVRDVRSIEILIDLLKARVGSSTSYSALAEDLQVSIHTVKHWLQILENLYVVFPVRPYHKNIARSILKSPKYYFYDTGAVEGDIGSKLENVVALALLKELHFLEDTTGCKVSLHYLRDKSNHEVDFLSVIDNKPTLLAEVKVSDENFSKSIFRFRSNLEDTTSVQVVYNLTRNKSSRGVRMLPAHEFLADLDLAPTKQNRI